MEMNVIIIYDSSADQRKDFILAATILFVLMFDFIYKGWILHD